MPAADSAASIPPDPPAPFALIVAPPVGELSADALETRLRHMGLRPKPVAADGAVESPCFRLHLGSTVVRLGAAPATALALADPADRATSSLAASLPAAWRDTGRCWAVVPEDDHLFAPAGNGVRIAGLFNLTALLVDLFDASHMFWSPARLWSDAAQFRTAIAEMQVSGMPPVLHLVAFRRHADGADEAIATRGLALFVGQELEGPIPVGWTVADMVRRLARLALDLMLNGPVQGPRRVRGLDPGEWVELSALGPRGDPPPRIFVEFGRDG